MVGESSSSEASQSASGAINPSLSEPLPSIDRRHSGEKPFEEVDLDVNTVLALEASEAKREDGERKIRETTDGEEKKIPGSKKWWSKKSGEDREKRNLVMEQEADEEGEKEKKEIQEETIGNFIKILSFGTRLDRFMQIIGSICALGAGAAFPLMTLPFGNLATTFTRFMNPSEDFTPHQLRKEVDKLCLVFVYLFIGKLISGYIALLCFRVAGTRISSKIRLRYLECVFSQPISYFDLAATQKTKEVFNRGRGFGATGGSSTNQGSGAIVVAITSSSNTIQAGISERMGLFFQYAAMLIVAFVIAFTKNWELTLITLLILPASVFVYGITIPMDIALEKKIVKAYTTASTLAEETLSTIRTVKAFNAQKKLADIYAAQISEAKKVGLAKTPITGIQSSAAFFVIYAGYGLCFWYGIRMFQHGRLKSVGEIFTVFFAVLIAVLSISNLAPQLGRMSKASGAAAEMFEVIDKSQELVEKKKEGRKFDDELGEANSSTGKKWNSKIELRNVSFTYPTRPNIPILEGLSVVFEEGKTTAIVGSSGSGKSTIVGLLERWYDLHGETDDNYTNHGEILVNGDVDIRDLNIGWWRSQIGLVQQEPVLFNDTIYNNVCHGLVGSRWENVGEEEKRRMVREACIQANATEFIDQLPESLDTRVGEQGVKLSGGQKQRIAIARSIIKQPPILIFDEATSAIDPKNERIVQETLDKVSNSRTTIVIAHRLSTVKMADKIVVMGKGKIVEQGTHEELMKIDNGAYKRLVEGQKLLMEREGVDEAEGAEEGESHEVDLARRVTTAKSVGDNDGKSVTGEDEEGLTNMQRRVKKMGIIQCLGLMLFEQRRHWFVLVLALSSSIVGGGAYPAQAIMFAKFTAVFGESKSMDDLVKTGNFWALMFFVLALSALVGYAVLGAAFTRVEHILTAAYRLEYFHSMIRQPVSFFDKEQNSTGTLTSLLNSDPSALLLGTSLGMLLVAIVNLVSCSILALIVGWKLSLVVLAIAVPLTVTASIFRVRIELTFEKDTAAVFAESSQFAAEAVGSFRTITSLTLEDKIVERYRILLDDHVNRAYRKARIWMWFFSASECINFLSMALAFWYGGRLISWREYTIYQFFVVYIALIQGGEAAGQFLGFSPDVAQAKAASQRILGLREDSPPPPGVTPVGTTNRNEGCEVRFKNVYFQYPSRVKPVFKNLSFTIEKGQFAAFVGASGCGKTTIISLLERFYDAANGEILIDGQNIKDLDITEYRQMVSLVSQEPTLYRGSIMENVLLGAPEGATEDDVISACKLAYIHEFISSLPEGYQTQLGSKGVGLSGGQKQRIAIARAVIRNPKVLLLDEATSSLDSTSEKLVQMSFEQAKHGRTMIAVAHRLSTIQKADVIFVFDEGKIVEQGTHGELIRKGGVYYQMCQSQLLEK